MDIVNPALGRSRRRRRWLVGAGAVVSLGLGAGTVWRLEPAVPSVERETLFVDTVRRGEMVRLVRGSGTLVPIEVRWIAAPAEARVERIAIEPGEEVDASTVLLELSSPEVEQSARDAQASLTAAMADYARVAAQLDAEQLNREAAASAVESAAEQAQIQAQLDARLAEEGLVSEVSRRYSEARSADLTRRAELERRRVEKGLESAAAQLAAERARVDQATALAELRSAQLEALSVRAGIAGVLQQVDAEPGQRVELGKPLARVARTDRLRAEIRIAETQAKDVVPGQPVEIDTRNGIIPGRVDRIDPAARNGTVAVHVELPARLPGGARPDLSVDGRIEIERLRDVLHLGRPAVGQPGSTITLLKLEPDGRHAVRVPVRLGAGSVNTIEITDGLVEGDRVILSDTSAWDGLDRLRID
jgi:HlyD family secretion protein